MSASKAPTNRHPQFKLRSDLQFVEYAAQASGQLVIKDPVKLEYFQFRDFEAKLLAKLKQPITASQLKQFADDLLRPRAIDLSEIHRFLHRLIRDNLLVAENYSWGANYYRNFRQQKRFHWLRLGTGVLSIRFRGFNPRNFLELLNPLTRYLFHPTLMLVACVMFIVALIAFALNVGQLIGSSSPWLHLDSSRLLVPLGLALITVKILHEFGHALACRSIGRDCHEMGVMLFAFVPCLYCNVSDTWMEPDRKKRMLVSAAGIYVEMLVAIACVPLWLTCNYKPLQFFFLSAIMICSVNTLLINGNPLLRYDGYYVLSDWFGIPNLQSESRKLVGQRIGKLLGVGSRHKTPDRSFWLEIYGVASQLYRWMVLSVIVFAVYTFFCNIDLPNVGLTISFLVVVTAILLPLVLSFRRLMVAGGRQKPNILKPFAVLATIVALVAATSLIPIQTKNYGTGEVIFPPGSIVYASDSGEIQWLADAGSSVQIGQEIAVIANNDLDLKIVEQQQRILKLQLAMEQAKLLQSQGADNSREMVLNTDALASAKRIEAELQQQRDKLTIRALQQGKLTPLPQKTQTSPPFDLTRSNTTLKNSNAGAFVKRSEPIAVISPLDGPTIRLQVSERQARYVEVGQSVRMVIPQLSTEILAAKVTDIGIGESVAQQIASEQNEELSQTEHVTVLAKLDDSTSSPFHQSKVYATILGDKMPIHLLVRRFIRDNFDF